MKKAKRPTITLTLDPRTLETLTRQARAAVRSRANYASFLIKEGVAREAKFPRIAEMRAEFERRANMVEPAPAQEGV